MSPPTPTPDSPGLVTAGPDLPGLVTARPDSPALVTARPDSPGLVTAWRSSTHGDLAEMTHRVHVVIARTDGSVVAQAGDPALETPLRSCLKPFQAQVLRLSGAAERFAVTSQEWALACASHDAAPLHTELVQAWLARLGLGVAALSCGAHAPTDPEGLAALAGQPPSALHNNCSGKHTAMLAAALALGAPTRDYLRAAHPVQALVRQALDEALAAPASAPIDDSSEGLAARRSSDLAWCVDGCSAPTPALTLREIATLSARLADPESRWAPTYDAMREHAELVGGRGVLDTMLMRALGGLIAKRGADGVYAIGVRPGRPGAGHHLNEGPLGISIKVESGSTEARAPAVLAVLDALGHLGPAARVALAPLIRPARKNVRDLVVGHWSAALHLHEQLRDSLRVPTR